MITILVGTNRPDANSRKIAQALLGFYAAAGIEAQLLDLADLLAGSLEDQAKGFAAFVSKLYKRLVLECARGFNSSEQRFCRAADLGLWSGGMARFSGMRHSAKLMVKDERSPYKGIPACWRPTARLPGTGLGKNASHIGAEESGFFGIT